MNEDIEAENVPLCILESSWGGGSEDQSASKTEIEPEEEAPMSNQNENENGDVIYTHVNDEFENEIEETKTIEREPKQDSSESEKATESEKAKEKTAKDQEALEKKEKLAKADRERFYKLPLSSHLIVHPSKTAKGGKFECQLVSLSHLLDYRREDNKESTFEVSLFAEYFNEMLMRDFGFLIYKHILGIRTEKDKELLTNSLASNNKRKLSVSNGSTVGDDKKEDVESKRVKPNEDASK